MLRKLFGFGQKAQSPETREAARFGIDLEMNYCPSCGDEYRSDISECISCKVGLISGSEKLERKKSKEAAFNGRSMEISESDERVVIKNGKLRDLKPYQVLLAKERIPTLITGESAGCGKG